MGKKKLKFEDALRRLEEISNLLESDETELEEMISLYEEGTKLAKYCYDELKNAELKIEKLTASLNPETTENIGDAEIADDVTPF